MGVTAKASKEKERIEGQRTAAKDAFKSGLGVDAIGDEELEEMLKETSKTEMSKNLDACYDIAMTKDVSAKKGYLSNCRKEAMKTAKDARMPKKGSIEEVLETGIAGDIAEIAALDTIITGMPTSTDAEKAAKATKVAAKEAKVTAKESKETERDVSFKKMMNEVAQETASVTMAAAMRAKPDMTQREKLDAVKAAMKESLGKPDKCDSAGVCVSQVTETDAELFLGEAAIDEVDSVMPSCVESRDKLADGYNADTAMTACETKAKNAFKAFRGGEEAALDTEINGVESDINTYTTDITALENTISTMPTSTEEEKTLKATKVAEKDAKVTAKASKEKEKVTKQEKKKLKTREIEYTFTKSKQDAGRKNALAKVKAKMEDAKSKNIDMNTVAFKNEKRAMAKDAFKASMAVDTIEDVEMEKLLIETSKKEASDQLDAAYEIAQSATTDADIRTAFPGAGAKIEAYKTALDDANTKLDTDIAAAQAAGKADEVTKFQTEKNANLAKKTTVPPAELKKIKWRCAKDTAKAAAKDARTSKDGSTAETFEDSEFAAMMNDVAGDKAVATMAAAMRAKPDMTNREKYDAVKIEMKKSLASDEPIDDSTVKHFLKKGAIKKAREVAKIKISATTTAADKRKSVQAAMKESLGKPDKLDANGVLVSYVTEADAEMFVTEASIQEVGSILSACVESGETDEAACGVKATQAIKDTLPGAGALGPKALEMKLDAFRKSAARKEISALKEGCGTENTDDAAGAAACKKTLKAKMRVLLGKKTIEDKEVEEMVLEGSEDTAQSYMEACKEDASKDFAKCRDEDVKKAILRSRGKPETAPIEKAELQETIQRGVNGYVKSRISACLVAAETDADKKTACTSDDAIQKDLEKMISDKSGRRLATVTKEEIVKMRTRGTVAAVKEAAESTENLGADDKVTEFRRVVKEVSGVDLTKSPMQEQELLDEAAVSKIAQVARACANAGATSCDVTSEFDKVSIGKSEKSEKRAALDTEIAAMSAGAAKDAKVATKAFKEKMKKVKTNKKGARKLVKERMAACLDADEVDTIVCVKNIKNTYKHLANEKYLTATIRNQKSKMVAEKVRTCMKAQKVKGEDKAARKVKRKACRVDAKMLLGKITDKAEKEAADAADAAIAELVTNIANLDKEIKASEAGATKTTKEAEKKNQRQKKKKKKSARKKTAPEDVDSSVARHFDEQLLKADTECDKADSVKCFEAVKLEALEEFGIEDGEIEVKRMGEADRMASDELAASDIAIADFDTEIAALDIVIAGMPISTDDEKAAKATKVATKATKTAAKEATALECETEVIAQFEKMGVSKEHYDATKPAREKVRKAKNDGADTKIETFADDVTTRLVFEGTCDDATVERARDQTGVAAAGKTTGVGAPTKKVSAGVVSGNCVATFRTRVPTKPVADVIKDGTTAADDAAKLIAATKDLGKDKSKRRLNSGSRNLGG